MLEADVIVVGSGIAGASLAAHLAATCTVIVLEGETRPGYHATGRSAALFSEIYGNSVIRALTRASRDFLRRPDGEFTPSPLTRPRASLFIATTAQLPALQRLAALPDVAPETPRVTAAEARELCPAPRAEYVAAALLEHGSADIDVHALHDGYLRQCRRRGGRNVQPEEWDVAVAVERIQTATLPADLLELGLRATDLSPSRFVHDHQQE